MNDLRDLFSDEDYRFRLNMRRGEPANFFRPQDSSGTVLRERNLWLDRTPKMYADLLPEGAALLAELKHMASPWGLDTNGDIQGLAGKWEPDFLLLAADDEGRFRLQGGALCFPTGWALSEKLGQTLDRIHGIVPGLNEAIGPAIDQFLHGLKPGPAFLRQNWGITATDELNLHPTRRIPSPHLPINLAELWLRVEHQVLVALPLSLGVLFGIRISLHRLDKLAKDPDLAAGLGRSLHSMAPELAIYKGLAKVNDPLAALLIENAQNS